MIGHIIGYEELNATRSSLNVHTNIVLYKKSDNICLFDFSIEMCN